MLFSSVCTLSVHVFSIPAHDSNRLIADKQIPAACVKFAQVSREVLTEKDIVQNFMAHLINLCDFGLISPAVIRASMNIIHQPPS